MLLDIKLHRILRLADDQNVGHTCVMKEHKISSTRCNDCSTLTHTFSGGDLLL